MKRSVVMCAVASVVVGLAAAASAGKVEAIDDKRVTVSPLGVYSLDGAVVGTPNDSFHWLAYLEKRHVYVMGPEDRGLVDMAPVQLADGTLLVVAGGESVHSPYAVSSIVRLDKWEETKTYRGAQPGIEKGPAPAFARLGATAVLLADGKVLVAGGGGKFPDYTPVTTAEIFDPKTKAFRSLASTSLPRREGMSTVLKDGRVLLTGGLRGPPSAGLQDELELFDPKTETFRKVGKLQAVRYRHATTVLPDGRVMIVGGASLGKEPPRLIEYFDPKTDALQAGGELAAEINGPVALTLPSGDVLLTGGSTMQMREGSHGRAIGGYFDSGQSSIIHTK